MNLKIQVTYRSSKAQALNLKSSKTNVSYSNVLCKNPSHRKCNSNK
jgi:hypothetical protein